MKRLRTLGAGLVTAVALIQAAPAAVSAHAFPIRSEPRVGRSVAAPPAKVTIWFDGELEPAFSTIAVYNSAKQRVDKNNTHVSSADATILEVDLVPLPPGTYQVEWRVLAKDTHVTEGNFSFTVASS
ncbi:MAG TPA: copper resistance CopC family protein [Candidatus Binatia bacterium]|jgi:hypothetical protein